MMNAHNRAELEKFQTRILKVIYGYKVLYSSALKLANIPTLEARRDDTLKKFTIKTAANPHFEEGFPHTFPLY